MNVTGAAATAGALLASLSGPATAASTASGHNGPQDAAAKAPVAAWARPASASRSLPAITGAGIVANASAWYIGANNPPYDQGGFWQSRTVYAGDGRGDHPRPGGNPPAWREDCSGFLAHAWGEVDGGGGFNTFTIGSYSKPIAWSQLQPGDALLFNGINVGGEVVNHVGLFVRWDSPSTYSVMDESTPGSGTQLQNNIPVGRDGFWQYGQPIRDDALANDPISSYYSQLGGAGSYLGSPIDNEHAIAGGDAQDFVGGSIFWSPATGAHVVHGAILGRYLALGGPAGILGFPLTDETAGSDGVGRFNNFSGYGSIYWTPSSGAWSIHGSIRDHWKALGAERGPLGYPTSDETATADGIGRYNTFNGGGGSGGSIYWTPSIGVWSIHGSIRDHWIALGAERGPLGYPTSDETATADGIGRYNTFNGGGGGAIYWTPTTGSWSVHGAIGNLWTAIGGVRSSLGYPISDEYAIPIGRQSSFRSGTISWNATSGATTITPG